MTTTRLNFDLPLLDKLSDGIILLDRRANVLAMNSRAEPWAHKVRAMAGVLGDLLTMEVRRRVHLPVKLGVWHGQPEQPDISGEAWLIMNGRRDYAIFIARCDGSSGATARLPYAQTTETAYLRLLGDEARAQLVVLRQMLNPQSTVAHNSVVVSAQSQRVEHLLQELSDLSLLLQRDEVFAGERLDLGSVVRAAFPPASSSGHLASPAFVMRHQGNPSGAVYGHAVWMSHALRVLFEALQSSAPAGSQISVSTRQMGGYVVLSGRVMATVDAPHRQPSPDAAIGPDQVGAQRPVDPQVRWAMCRRIIALHAGQLKLETLAPEVGADPGNPAIESFTLTLATGQPAHERSRASCNSCPHVMQAQAYATDLAQLLNPH